MKKVYWKHVSGISINSLMRKAPHSSSPSWLRSTSPSRIRVPGWLYSESTLPGTSVQMLIWNASGAYRGGAALSHPAYAPHHRIAVTGLGSWQNQSSARSTAEETDGSHHPLKRKVSASLSWTGG